MTLRLVDRSLEPPRSAEAAPWVWPRAAYVHIPFCAHKCGYCYFASLAGVDHLADRYLGALEREMAFLGEPQEVDTIFVGGGTPTRLDAHQLARLSGAAVVAFQHLRRPDGGYTLRIVPALEDIPSKDATADTAKVMAAIEAMARAARDQYLWIHRRFKRRPQGVPDPYR